MSLRYGMRKLSIKGFPPTCIVHGVSGFVVVPAICTDWGRDVDEEQDLVRDETLSKS